MKILISPLGLAPGVVTGAFYALCEKYGNMDAIITVSTTGDLVHLCEREVQAELDRAERELGVAIKYEERLHIPTDELRNISDVYRFRRCILDLLQANLSAGHEVYLNLTGGRKSMVAAAAMAAQHFARAKTFYIHVPEEVEREGHIAALLKKSSEKRHDYLKPNDVTLVEIPFLSLNETTGVDLMQWQARIFEIEVADYLYTRLPPPYTRIQPKFYPNYLHGEGLGEVDIFASREVDSQTEVLLCECKLRKGPAESEWAARLARKRQKVIEVLALRPELVKAWIIIVAAEIEDNEEASKHGIEIYQARLPNNWEGRADWRVEELRRLL